MYASYHRCQVRREDELHGPARHRRETLNDFRHVSVSGDTIGFEIVRRFGEQRMDLGLATGAGNA
jgi:hypothetical protein